MAWKQITRVEITNFQSHKHTVIEPSPGVTVIVGHSDSGKSAFIRAIKWCLYNKQPKSPIINKDADYVEVSVSFSDGTIITRHKSDKENMYQIVTPEEQKVFTSVGNTPLKEVMDATGMYEIDIFNKNMSLNMVEQFDNLFFLAENATDKGTLISQMANTEICDNAIAMCSTEISSIKKIITRMNKDLKVKKENLAKYAFLEDAKDQLDIANNIKDSIDKDFNIAESLRSEKMKQQLMLISLKIANQQMPELSAVDDTIQKAQNVINNIIEATRVRNSGAIIKNFYPTLISLEKTMQNFNIADITEVSERLNAIAGCFSVVQAITNAISLVKQRMPGVSKNIPLSIEDIDDTQLKLLDNEVQFKMITSVHNQQLNMKHSVQMIQTLDGEIANLAMQKEKKISAYKKMLEESGVCPVCGSAMDEEHLHHAGEVL